jgi:hypothetical protein
MLIKNTHFKIQVIGYNTVYKDFPRILNTHVSANMAEAKLNVTNILLSYNKYITQYNFNFH